MPKDKPLTDPVPATCPECTSRVKTAGNIFDQKKATALKLLSALVLGSLTIIGVMVLWFVVGRISGQLVLVVVGVALLPSAIVYAFANAIPKIKEVRCSKCRWTEHYLIQVTNPGA